MMAMSISFMTPRFPLSSAASSSRWVACGTATRGIGHESLTECHRLLDRSDPDPCRCLLLDPDHEAPQSCGVDRPIAGHALVVVERQAEADLVEQELHPAAAMLLGRGDGALHPLQGHRPVIRRADGAGR